MNTDRTKAEQNFKTCATNMRKFVHEYALILLGEFDEIGHTAMKHPVHAYFSNDTNTCVVTTPHSLRASGSLVKTRCIPRLSDLSAWAPHMDIMHVIHPVATAHSLFCTGRRRNPTGLAGAIS